MALSRRLGRPRRSRWVELRRKPKSWAIGAARRCRRWPIRRSCRRDSRTFSQPYPRAGRSRAVQKFCHTGEGRCPWQNWVLAFPTELRPWAEGPREDKAGSVALNHPDASRR